jgi:hypothetical protein
VWRTTGPAEPPSVTQPASRIERQLKEIAAATAERMDMGKLLRELALGLCGKEAW